MVFYNCNYDLQIIAVLTGLYYNFSSFSCFSSLDFEHLKDEDYVLFKFVSSVSTVVTRTEWVLYSLKEYRKI